MRLLSSLLFIIFIFLIVILFKVPDEKARYPEFPDVPEYLLLDLEDGDNTSPLTWSTLEGSRQTGSRWKITYIQRPSTADQLTTVGGYLSIEDEIFSFIGMFDNQDKSFTSMNMVSPSGRHYILGDGVKPGEEFSIAVSLLKEHPPTLISSTTPIEP
jgi:hypothetical protein